MLSGPSTVVEKQFIELGLTANHGKVYIANLETGNAPASAIAKRAGLPRSTVYGLLNDIKKIGLVSKVKEETKTMFSPAPPNKVLELLNMHLSNLQQATNDYANTLAELESIYSSHKANMPTVRYYEGEDGLRNVLWDTFCEPEVLWTCQENLENKGGLDADPQYLRDYIEESRFRKQKQRELLQDAPTVREYVERHQDKYHQFCITPATKEKEFGHVDKVIYGNKIAYISHDNLTGIIIEDSTLASAERHQFETQWKYWSSQKP